MNKHVGLECAYTKVKAYKQVILEILEQNEQEVKMTMLPLFIAHIWH